MAVDAASGLAAGGTDLDDIDLSDRDFWVQPPEVRHAVFDRLRAERPFAFFAEPEVPGMPVGPGYYAVTRHADLDAISSQPQVFCSGEGAVSIQDIPADLHEFYGSMISMDDPRHARIRRIVSKTFTPRMLERVVDSVRGIVEGVLDEARRTAEANDGRLDVVADVAAPIPLRVICDMMGVPADDRDQVLAASNVILSGGDPELIEDEGERLTHQEIASFFILLLVAGNETTRNAISQGILALSEHPGQRARWMADPSIDKTAVEEIVRWTSPITWMRRTATQDGEVNGHRFAAGDKFLLFYAAANRDPALFADPHVFDLTRDPNPHVGFGGHGPHFCLGAHLARREIAVTFRQLFQQLPDLEVAGEPARLRSSFVNGLKRLPARLTGVR